MIGHSLGRMCGVCVVPVQALVVEARPPPCATWNFQINNYWMESLDYRYSVVHFNK